MPNKANNSKSKKPQNQPPVKRAKLLKENKPRKIKRRNPYKRSKIKPIIVGAFVMLLIALGITADMYYADTLIGQMISSTIGKFFNIVRFFDDHHVTLLESITIVFFVWVLSKVISIVLKLLFRHSQRTRTIGVIMTGIIRYILVLVGIFLILGAWGVEAPTLLAGVGILGLAISFGAQSLIEDILSGLFIISEKQFSIGDVIEIDGFRGTVIEMSLRTTKFENIHGDTKIMNNGDIRGAINTSSNLSPAICDIAVSYEQDIPKVEKVIYDNLDVIRENLPAIIDGPYYRGVQALADSSVILRIVGHVHEGKKLQTVRDLNREMKILFDKYKIKIPFPQLVVHYEKDRPQPTAKTLKKPEVGKGKKA